MAPLPEKDFNNAMGQESLTRLDQPKRKNKNNKKKKPSNQNNSNNTNNSKKKPIIISKNDVKK